MTNVKKLVDRSWINCKYINRFRETVFGTLCRLNDGSFWFYQPNRDGFRIPDKDAINMISKREPK